MLEIEKRSKQKDHGYVDEKSNTGDQGCAIRYNKSKMRVQSPEIED